MNRRTTHVYDAVKRAFEKEFQPNNYAKLDIFQTPENVAKLATQVIQQSDNVQRRCEVLAYYHIGFAFTITLDQIKNNNITERYPLARARKALGLNPYQSVTANKFTSSSEIIIPPYSNWKLFEQLTSTDSRLPILMNYT